MPNLTFRLTIDLDADLVALLGRLGAAAETLAAAPAAPASSPASIGCSAPGESPSGEQRPVAPPRASGLAPPDGTALPRRTPRAHGEAAPAPPAPTRDGFPSVAEREAARHVLEAGSAPASYETAAAWADANGVPRLLAGDSRIARLRRINARRRALGLPVFSVPAPELAGRP